MNQLPRTINLVFVLMFIAAACNNLPASATPMLESTATSMPAPSPTIALLPTQAALTIRAKEQPVNCRFGPGLVFEIVDIIKPNQSTWAIGRTSDNLWLNVQDPGNPGGVCWVAASAVEIEGSADLLSVASVSLATVTNLTVRVEPSKITVACNAFPQVFGFIAEITTNGPVIVTWRWEVNTGNSPDQTLTFEGAGTKTVREFYRVNGANDYNVKLHVLGPNEMIGEANFFALCTP